MAFDRVTAGSGTDVGSILMVCEDAQTRSEFAGLFQCHGYDVQHVDFAGVESTAVSTGFDLVIYDERKSPGRAISFCRISAVQGGVPIIVLCQQHDAVGQIVALEVGADEVLAGPVDGRLLLARARALLRRMRCIRSHAAHNKAWGLDPISRIAKSPGGATVELARHQVRLMQHFLDNPGVVLTAECVSGRDPALRMEAAAFRTAISRLRRRLELTGDADFIRVVRGSGYLHPGHSADAVCAQG